MQLRNRSATTLSSSSPIGRPSVSFTLLKWSIVLEAEYRKALATLHALELVFVGFSRIIVRLGRSAQRVGLAVYARHAPPRAADR